MIIDKTKTITKIVGIICAIGAVIGLVLTFRGFNYYRLIVALSNAALAFTCFKGIGKDKWFCVGIFGFMTIFEIVRVFFEESITISSAIFLLIRIVSYAAIVAYLLGVIKNKVIPIIGGIIICLLMIRNIYVFIVSLINLQSSMSGYTGANISLFNGNTFINIIGLVTYIFPALSMTLLIATGATKFTKE